MPTASELEDGLDLVRAAPASGGAVAMIVSRPATGERVVADVGELDVDDGLVGDSWRTRGSTSTADGAADPDAQLTLMGVRAVALVAGVDRSRWPLAGDQLYVDLDLSEDNLPVGTRLALGTAVVEITAKPHPGCAKFTQRFGLDAFRLVNSPEGKRLRLRGVYARVVTAGQLRVGDRAEKMDEPG